MAGLHNVLRTSYSSPCCALVLFCVYPRAAPCVHPVGRTSRTVEAFRRGALLRVPASTDQRLTSLCRLVRSSMRATADCRVQASTMARTICWCTIALTSVRGHFGCCGMLCGRCCVRWGSSERFSEGFSKPCGLPSGECRSGSSGRVAGFLAETIQGVGGAVELAPGYLPKVYEVPCPSAFARMCAMHLPPTTESHQACSRASFGIQLIGAVAFCACRHA